MSEQRYKLALEGSKDGRWEWNSTNNLFYFSDTSNAQPFEKAKGVTLDAWKDMIHPEDQEKAVSIFEKYLVAGKGTYKDALCIIMELSNL